ncbi:MAG TPA: GNAT family N-acetyltransferase [Thermoanaerobaculia bacterium]|nr:GNAT family N-acetyltransferase [Thermoanaerobaculia bacterium]
MSDASAMMVVFPDPIEPEITRTRGSMPFGIPEVEREAVVVVVMDAELIAKQSIVVPICTQPFGLREMRRIALDDVTMRRAGAADCEGLADAHRDSILAIGPRHYPPDVVEAWQEGLTGDLYRTAMEAGEVFFIATATLADAESILGFASDYRIDGSKHGTSVYVRGRATRCGIGSALLRLAEAHAVSAGAVSIHIEASLAAVEFYKANGYVEIERGRTHLRSGYAIDCAFMRKDAGRGVPRLPAVC